MTLKILTKQETQEVLEKLNEQFGITQLNGILLTYNYEKIFLYRGSFTEEQIKKIEKIAPIERIGVYLAKFIEEKSGNKKLRLSIEGSQIFREQISKNIFDLNEEQMNEWLKGNEINIQIPEDKRNFLIMIYNGEFLGTGKASESKITNFIPKNRRLKEKTI